MKRYRTVTIILLLTLLSAAGTLLGAPLSAQGRPASPPTCSSAAVALSSDYAYTLGSAGFSDPDGDSEAGSAYRWIVNGAPLTATAVAEGLLLHFDNNAAGANGETPTSAQNVGYAAGHWGAALALPTDGELTYPRPDNLSLSEGAIELWVALRAAGNDPIYSQQSHVLFFYPSAGDDYLLIAQSKDAHILYAGGVVDSEWESAYGSRGDMSGWQAGEWHHLAFTYSESGNFMRFYVDGVLAADTNEDHYWAPDADGSDFAIGGSPWWSNTAHYWIDAVRLSGRAATADEIAARARRLDAPRANEIWLPTAALTPGDSLAFEFTPAAAGETGAPCVSDPLEFPGIPLLDPQPPSTLLPPGATSFDFTATTITPTLCAYSLAGPLPYAQMTPFGEAGVTTTHQTTVAGLDPDPNTINHLYVRCASHPDFYLSQQYRSLSQVNPSFPRTGNLWGWWEWLYDNNHPLEYLAKVDLWLGAGANADQIRQLRLLNPDIRVLTSINAVENNDLDDPRCNGCTGEACEDWYLHDVNGQRIEVWPGSWRINLTNFEVAEYQACYAYQTVLDSGLQADGVFFDNVMTTQSWQDHDIYGNPVAIDYNNDGIADDPEAFDAAWKAGVFHEIETFREYMPYAIVNGHSMNIYETGIGELFDGISLGFHTANVLEGEESFAWLWDLYTAWMNEARQPPYVMFESSPIDQIAYGYDYEPLTKIPASTLEFARTYYPWMRFGLALTLMNDGYFAHEYGDTWHGNDWWYDELDFDLGYPLGPAQRVATGFDPGPNQIENGGFEAPIDEPWDFWANGDEGCVASVERDAAAAASGSASARVTITATSGVDWHVDFDQDNRSLQNGVVYDLAFWAKADRPRNLTLGAQKNSPGWDNYGLWREVILTTDWQPYTVTFQATATANDARIQFFVGEVTGTVWLDDVRLTLHPPDIYRRDYTHGIVLLNGAGEPQTVALGPGFQRLSGDQAALVEFILDDSDEGFTITAGSWSEPTIDSGEWKASGPFYHAWETKLRHLDSAYGEARWDLPITASDVYTITAWWPAAPAAITWTQSARFEVVAAEQVIASATLDQRQGGDEWRLIAAVSLGPADQPYIRLVCSGGAPCVADALHIRSAARYNNGQATAWITLQPLDGIVLRRLPWRLYLPILRR